MKTLLIVCSCGLGNRLNMLANLYSLTVAYPTIPFYIGWGRDNHCDIPIEELLDLTHMYGNKNVVISNKDELNSLKYSKDVVWCGAGVDEPNKHDNIDNWKVIPNVAVAVGHRFFRFCTDAHARYFFTSILKFNNKIVSLFEHTRDLYKITHNTISIHIRMGDLVNIYCKNNNINSNLYKQAMANILIENIDPLVIKDRSAKILLCTDNLEIYTSIKDRYPGNIIERKVVYPIVVDDIKIKRTTESIVSSVVDLLLLYNTQLKIFCPYSTFSVLAVLGGINKIQYDIYKKETTPIIYAVE